MMPTSGFYRPAALEYHRRSASASVLPRFASRSGAPCRWWLLTLIVVAAAGASLLEMPLYQPASAVFVGVSYDGGTTREVLLFVPITARQRIRRGQPLVVCPEGQPPLTGSITRVRVAPAEALSALPGPSEEQRLRPSGAASFFIVAGEVRTDRPVSTPPTGLLRDRARVRVGHITVWQVLERSLGRKG